MIFVQNTDKCLEMIRQEFEQRDKHISSLIAENKRLRDEAYKDNELQRIQSRLKKMEQDYYRGFPISEEEAEVIETWRKKHEEQCRRSVGLCGGRYSYYFVPTSLGVVGTVRCSCGAECQFQEMG